MIERICVTTVVCCLAFCPVRAASDGSGIISEIAKKLKSAKSFTAELDIHVAIPFIEAPPSKATMYFKSPGRSKIKVDGFSMIPKQITSASLVQVFTMPHSTVDAGYETFRGKNMRKIKIIPTEANAAVAIATVLVDTTMMLPMKIVATTTQGGTATTELEYNDAVAKNYAQPSYMKFIVELSPMELPRTMTGDFDRKSAQATKKMLKGTVQIWFTGYHFNVAIADSVFTDSK